MTLCCCSEEKFFGPAANLAGSSQQLLGLEEFRGGDLEGRQKRGTEEKDHSFAHSCEDWGTVGN